MRPSSELSSSLDQGYQDDQGSHGKSFVFSLSEPTSSESEVCSFEILSSTKQNLVTLSHSNLAFTQDLSLPLEVESELHGDALEARSAA